MVKKDLITVPYLLIFISAILMVRPYYIQYSPVNSVWAVLTVICSLALVIVLFKSKVLKRSVCFLSFFFLFFISTLLNCPENIAGAVSLVCQVFLAYEVGILYSKKKYKEAIKEIVPFIFKIYIVLDCISIVLNTSYYLYNLERDISFLGYDNYVSFNLIPMMAIILFLDADKPKKTHKIDCACILLVFFCKVITKTYAFLLAFVVFFVILLIRKNRAKIKVIFNTKTVSIFLVLMFLGIYFFNIQNMFAFVLGAMGKGVTLNSRTTIWSFVVPKLPDCGAIGLGNISGAQFPKFFGFPDEYQVTHAHNLVLDLIVKTGFVGLIIYFVILFVPFFNVKNKKTIGFEYMSIGLMSYLFLCFFDSYIFLSVIYLQVAIVDSIRFEKSEPLSISS